VIINPQKILKKRTTIKPIAEKAIQPNSIDLTIKEARLILDGGVLNKESKFVAVANPLETDRGAMFVFEANKAYDIVFNEYVIVPKGTAAFVTHRSTLNRVGGFITAGIYDTGFNNYVGAVLRTNAKISIEKDARIATIYFVKAEESKLYDGSYQSKKKKKI
jgi:deoxycytidine triphosphate deaminase